MTDIKIFLMYTLAVKNIDKQKLRGWELVYGKGKVPVEIEQGKGIGE
ncbi:hypothetical protein AAJM89_06505 [Staphylococcus hominis]